MIDFDGFVARSNILITGGSSGIGLALARQLRSMGGRVHIAARRPDVLEGAATEVNAYRPEVLSPVTTHVCDVTSDESVQRLFDGLARDHAMPEVVVNCAGATVPARFTDTPLQSFAQTMDVNFTGAVRVCAQAVPPMIDRGEGYVLNVGSLASIVSVYGMTAYCASKFALRGFTESLRSELKPHGVTASLLCPPDTDTPMLTAERALRPPETEALSGSLKIMTPESVASAAIVGMRAGKGIIIPGFEGKTTALLQRFAPSLLEWGADRIVLKARRGND